MNDYDPKTNLVPFDLMNEAAKGFLKDWPHGWEYYSFFHRKWLPKEYNQWCDEIVYRGKPKPVVVSEWFNVYPEHPSQNAHSTRERADIDCTLDRIAVMRIDTCNGVSTAHLEDA
jgi:hypothetical protein